MPRPKFISFDCYGTLTRFRMDELAGEIYGDRVPADRMKQFCFDFKCFRMDEVMGAWKPYRDVLVSAVERTCRKHGVMFDEAEAERFYHAVPTWRPHEDVPPGLARLAKEFPLVGLSNAANEQIMANVAMYGAPFHLVVTAEDAGSYKPRMRGFEVMLDKLNARPEDMLHVSSSFRYDLMTAFDLGIKDKAWVNRGHEPVCPGYEFHEIPDIGGLPGLVGL